MVETKLNQVALPSAASIKVAQNTKLTEVLDDLCMYVTILNLNLNLTAF